MEFRERPVFRRGQSSRPLFRNSFVGAVVFSILLTGCSHKRPIPTRTDPSGPSAHRSKGAASESAPDSEQHLHGWQEAEAVYQNAYRDSGDPEVLDKLLTTQFLILTRQAEEEIYGPFQAERLSSLCSRATTSFHEILCRSAQVRLPQRGSIPAG